MKKRILAVALSATLLMALVGGMLPASALWVRTPVTAGDADGDGEVSTADAVLALQLAANLITEEDVSSRLMDVDGDGEVSTADAVLILQHAAKLITEFPCGTLYDVTTSDAERIPNSNPEEFADYTSQNPIITNMFTADPSAHVWKDGRLYLYPSHDTFPARGCDLMDKYHVFSTDNMVDWVDEGQILSSQEVMWSNCDGFMWAPDCVYIEKTETYYYFFPHPLTDEEQTYTDGQGNAQSVRGWNATWVMGVAASKNPAGPFEQLGYVKLPEELVPAISDADKANHKNDSLNGYFDSSYLATLKARDGKTLGDHGVSGIALGGWSLIDPCVFEDDDGKVYLYYGGGGKCFVVELADDMVTAKTAPKKLYAKNYGLTDFHEGAWMFKNPDTGFYYMVYADNNNGSNKGNQMRYGISRSPIGPFSQGGVILDPVTDCDTSHGSVAQYKGNWYLFYHNGAISGEGNLRSVCVDKLTFDENGFIQKVKQTTTGVEAVGKPSRSNTGGTNIPESSFTVKTDYDLSKVTVEGGATVDTSSVKNMHIAGSYCEFGGVDGGKGGKALLTVTYATMSKGNTKVNTAADKSGEGYFLRLPSTDSYMNYKTATCIIDLNAGTDNVIRLNGGFGYNIRGISVSLLPENAN